MNRRLFLAVCSGSALPLLSYPAQSQNAHEKAATFALRADRNIIPAPQDPAAWPEYRVALARWREQTRAQLRYNGALYQRAEFDWAATNFACCFVMMCDETFYNPVQGRYQVDEFLEDGQRQFGGYDSVVLWHAYPRIGVDERNQFDFYRDMPGGWDGVRDAVRQFHRRGVKVYVDYNPWDQGTRREGRPDLEVLAELVGALEADGIFLDTMTHGASEFRARLDQIRPGVILESEGAVPLENVHDHHGSWAQWFEDSHAPGVLRHKWLERRHMQHQIRRWNTDHSDELHCAWMNGSGMMIWENVFGSWVPWSERDKATLRAMLPIQRHFARLFNGERWMPLVPTRHADVYASLWEADGLRLWTLINRSQAPVQGQLLSIQGVSGQRVYDLVAGREISSIQSTAATQVSGSLGPRSIGCFVAGTEEALGPRFDRFLAERPGLAPELSAAIPQRDTTLKVPRRIARLPALPPGMIEIPPGSLNLKIDLRIRECGFYESMPAVGAGGYEFQIRTFRRQVEFAQFAIDETPVTNAQFMDFLEASGYRPTRPENFLKHWLEGRVPPGKEDHPVVYVALDDARAYARWAGKRLPTEEAWQYAAQGPDGRAYPWGNAMESGRCNPGTLGATTPVRQFPSGRSPFGCFDMCGNVWHWTESERTDGRTRFCIIRGGSWFAAQGSGWYVDGGPLPVNFATKFLLMWPGLDRCSTIGFRCAADLA